MNNYYDNLNQGFHYNYDDAVGIANAAVFDNEDIIENDGLEDEDMIEGGGPKMDKFKAGFKKFWEKIKGFGKKVWNNKDEILSTTKKILDVV